MTEMISLQTVAANGGTQTVGVWDATRAWDGYYRKAYVRLTCRECGNVAGHARGWNRDFMASITCRQCG